MKTLELKLKKDVFIVDIPIDAKNIYLSGDSVVFNTNKSCIIKSLNGNYKFLCKGSELTEEIASELVEDYSDVSDLFISCLDDFKKRIERCGFYWLENPISRPRNYELWAKYGDYTQYGIVLTEKCLKWQEAEGKTFRNPLIFVKK
jgi:hypothetical protein